MTTDAVDDWEPEPSPFDPEDPTVVPGALRSWEPARPMSQKDLDFYASLSWDARTFNPWHCMWNRSAEDGIGRYSGLGMDQCPTVLADPTKSRYCLEHARKMGVDYYSPPELAEATAAETSANLTRLVPKATKVLEMVMDDEDAPQGVRAKAASEVLDRTGYVRGVDVRVDAQVATVDITGLIKDRLDSLRDAHLDREAMLRAAVDGTVLPGPEPGRDAYRSAGVDGTVDDGSDPEPEGGSVTTVVGEIIDGNEHRGDAADEPGSAG